MKTGDTQPLDFDPKLMKTKLDHKGVKLTNWKKEPSIADLAADYEASKPFHSSQMAKVKRWDDLLFVKGAAKPAKVPGRSAIQPKLIRRQAEWRYSALTEPFLGAEKLFSVAPVTFEDQGAAKQNELVLNWQFRTKLNRVQFIDDCVRATVDEGTCIVRVGWNREVITVEEEVPAYSFYSLEDIGASNPEQAQQFQQKFEEAMQLMQDDPRAFEDTTPEEIKASISYFEESGDVAFAVAEGTEKIEKEKIIANHPTVDVLHLENVFIDPSCNGKIEQALFIVNSFESCKADLEKQGSMYKNLDMVDWKSAPPAGTSERTTNTPTDFNFKDEARKRVVVYEYWGYYDINGDGKLVPFVGSWINSTMIRLEESPFPDKKLPFVLMRYLPVKRELYGEPDAELLEDNQNILGVMTRGLIDLLGRSANAQRGFAKGLLDPLNRRRYDQGKDYDFNPNMPVSTGLIEHKYPEFPNSALTFMAMQNQESESLSGVKGFSGGMSGESYGQVAAGIRGVLDAASKREMAILRRIAKGIVEIGQKIISMNSVFLSDKEVVRVTNSEFVTINREDLAGNFDLQVDISTAEVDNNKSQDLSFMMQTLGPNMDSGITMMIMSEIAELKRMPVLADKLRKYKPEPSEQDMKMQELEMQMKEAELQKLLSEIELNKARTTKEESAAQQIGIAAEEQASGIAHDRAIEKMKAQSRGNQNLQITKALTTPKKKDQGDPDVEAAIGFNSISDKMNDLDGPIPYPNPTVQQQPQPQPQLPPQSMPRGMEQIPENNPDMKQTF